MSKITVFKITDVNPNAESDQQTYNCSSFFLLHVLKCCYFCFQDYEEDFEDVGEDEDDKEEENEKEEHENKAGEDKRELSPRRRQEIEAIQRAIDEENERIYSARSKPSTADSAVTQRGN